MRCIRSVPAVVAVVAAMLVASALPAAAQGFGPTVFCKEGTFDECTDNVHLGLSEGFFSCEGTIREAAGCTNQGTAEIFSYCVFAGHEPTEARDLYLCGPSPG